MGSFVAVGVLALLFMVVFAIVGLHIFGGAIPPHQFPNFNTFFNSLLTMFQVCAATPHRFVPHPAYQLAGVNRFRRMHEFTAMAGVGYLPSPATGCMYRGTDDCVECPFGWDQGFASICACSLQAMQATGTGHVIRGCLVHTLIISPGLTRSTAWAQQQSLQHGNLCLCRC